MSKVQTIARQVESGIQLRLPQIRASSFTSSSLHSWKAFDLRITLRTTVPSWGKPQARLTKWSRLSTKEKMMNTRQIIQTRISKTESLSQKAHKGSIARTAVLSGKNTKVQTRYQSSKTIWVMDKIWRSLTSSHDSVGLPTWITQARNQLKVLTCRTRITAKLKTLKALWLNRWMSLQWVSLKCLPWFRQLLNKKSETKSWISGLVERAQLVTCHECWSKPLASYPGDLRCFHSD